MKNQSFQVQKVLRSQNNRSEQGFSLIEVLVAMIIFLIVTGSIWGLLEVGRADRNRSSIRSDVLKNARMSINLIGRDALNAGLGYTTEGALVRDNFLPVLFGTASNGAFLMTADANTLPDLLSGVVVGNNVIANDLAGATVQTDTIAFAFNDPTFNPVPGNTNPVGSPANPGAPLNLVSYNSTGTESVNIATTNRSGSSNAVCSLNSIYLIEANGNQPILAMSTGLSGTNAVVFAPGDPLGLNLANAGTRSSASPASMKRISVVSYRVNQDGTLIRTTFGNVGVNPGTNPTGVPQPQPLAYNVENMQIQYLLTDGTVTDDPSVNGTTYAQVNKIRQITITLTVRGDEIDVKTGRPIKITLSSTFSTRNMNYGAV